jgi:hypothetical protein
MVSGRCTDDDDERVSSLLERSIAPSTRLKYLALWSRWESYCRDVGCVSLPAESGVVERFLANLAYDGTKTNYAAAAAAIAWQHSVAGFPSPTKSPRVVALMAGAKRMLAQPTVRKVALSVSLLRRIIDRSSDLELFSTEQVVLLRFKFYILVSFYALLRYSDFSVLRLRNFRFFTGYMEICIPNSKCDQYRNGSTISIAEQSSLAGYCAVKAARRYIDCLRSASAVDDTFVLQSVLVGQDGVHSLGSLASRDVLVKQLRCALFPLVTDTSKYTLHSLRSGGASAAASVPSVTRDELKRHGRWVSSAVDNYIEPSLDCRLSITKKMENLK